MRRFKNKYVRPKKVWDKARIEEEKQIKTKYGLKNMREIWKAEGMVKRIRKIAKSLITASQEEQKNFILSLAKYGFVSPNASIDDVLALDKTKILDRRLQTVVYKLGLANTPKQSRQFIVHGHVYIKGRRVNVPSYLVKIGEEKDIKVEINKSKINQQLEQKNQNQNNIEIKIT